MLAKALYIRGPRCYNLPATRAYDSWHMHESLLGSVHCQYCPAVLQGGQPKVDLPVKSARPLQCRVDCIWPAPAMLRVHTATIASQAGSLAHVPDILEIHSMTALMEQRMLLRLGHWTCHGLNIFTCLWHQ